MAEAFLEAARRTYGDLTAPDFSLVNEMIERRPYAPIVRRFAEFCTVEEEEASSWHDDVALSVSLQHGRRGCAVWMSYVAPYAVIHVGRAEGQPFRDTDFVHAGVEAPEWLRSVRSELERAGFWVMPPHVLRQEMEFYSVDDAAVQTMPLFRVFFTDLEDLFPFE